MVEKHGGESWELTMINHTINERAPYYTRLRIATDDPNEVYFASVRFSTSRDGGKHWKKQDTGPGVTTMTYG
jgi:hypothetical protein